VPKKGTETRPAMELVLMIRPRTCRAHRRQHRLHRADGPEIVGVHLFRGLRDAVGLGHADIHDARVVDQDVDGAIGEDAAKPSATEASLVTSISAMVMRGE
jgi:hypothetical protein